MLWVVMDDARNEEGRRAWKKKTKGYRKGMKNEKSVRREAFP